MMKHSNLRDLDNKLFSYFTPQGSVFIGMLIFFFGVLAVLTFTGCSSTPEEIRAEAAEINQGIDDAAEQAIAVKESAQAIRDNVKERVEEVIE